MARRARASSPDTPPATPAATQDVQHAIVALDSLTPHPRNYRAHPEAQIARLSASLARFSQVRSIVVQEGADGRYLIVAGHGLAEAARQSGYTELRADVIPATWSATAIEAYLIADNESSRGADDDLVALAAMLEEQQAAGYDLDALGYSDDELAALLEELAEAALAGGKRDVDDPDGGGDDFDTTPDESGPTRVQPGDIWVMGSHRLLCGDSTRAEDVAWLMAGSESFQCIWTDPPYGVAYQANLTVEEAKRLHRRTDGKEVANDSLTEPAVQQMLTDALSLAARYGVTGASAYVAAPAGPLHRRFIDAMNDSGFEYRHGLVWVKNVFVFGRSDYHYRHEPILYGWLQNGAHYFVDDRTHDSVFEVPRPRRSEEHPTMKPIELVAAMVANSSREGDAVYEPFAGSGTTLIAAERLGRKCRAIELDPRYCDVILRRWEAETGREATLLARADAVAVAAITPQDTAYGPQDEVHA